MENWQISKSHKNVLDSLFGIIQKEKIERVLDVGSGRTSMFYLTNKFKDLVIEGIVYPGDYRKLNPIKEFVKTNNYKLVETDINNFNFNKTFDIVLAHMFLGEAEKFNNNRFKEILEKLFSIKTKYLILVNLFEDNIDYNLLLSQISHKGNILKLEHDISDSGSEYLGMLIKVNNI